jgi:hypothetical protein
MGGDNVGCRGTYLIDTWCGIVTRGGENWIFGSWKVVREGWKWHRLCVVLPMHLIFKNPFNIFYHFVRAFFNVRICMSQEFTSNTLICASQMMVITWYILILWSMYVCVQNICAFEFKNNRVVRKLQNLTQFRCNIYTKLSYTHQIIFIFNMLQISCLVEVLKIWIWFTIFDKLKWISTYVSKLIPNWNRCAFNKITKIIIRLICSILVRVLEIDEKFKCL